jgi:Tfp pilus assembly protein FimT
MRPGYTLAETLLFMVIAGIAMGIAVPRSIRVLDRIVVQSAAGDVRATLATARALAIAGASQVTVDVDSASGTLRVRRGGEILFTRGVGSAHGVRLSRTRDSLTYGSRGLGRGAANLSVIVRRGSAAETVFVSRLGRVR